MGYEIRDWNASDEYNKKTANYILGDLKSNSILNLLKRKKKINDQKNNQVDDEVKVKTNKYSQQQWMKINPKVRSLTNNCYDIKFVKPEKYEMDERYFDIQSFKKISERFGNDIRQTSNFLEMYFKVSKKLQVINSKKLYSGQKDTTVILESSTDLVDVELKILKISLRERQKQRPFQITQNSRNKIRTQTKQSKSESSYRKYGQNLDDLVYSDTEKLQQDKNGMLTNLNQQDEQEKPKQKKQQKNKSKAPKTKKHKSRKS
ncbi:BRCT domain protein, putative (macronuclear) [Tetrahymena thermophila SB210]|uniref:BRCT domain protein, putative n=1 Tax=Tetrahymena thermophila (strain SB210) TaxID=312017 RepID=Q229X2_TETTS|nr:BRCT domain protein, putative [Tetrahymena thermophila SB210]EAR82082.2 BRCT domain protein, putative [Tetrahymena thermophila SB210]|eukprot:XP_001029745.2 BRCT domain protein, putative [Tetrahymena thermophila SB210]